MMLCLFKDRRNTQRIETIAKKNRKLFEQIECIKIRFSGNESLDLQPFINCKTVALHFGNYLKIYYPPNIEEISRYDGRNDMFMNIEKRYSF